MTEEDINQTYWNHRGKYQKAYDHFYNKLVPSSGQASTPEGELLRIISKIYYRYHNDGDEYWDMIEDGYLKITEVEDIESRFLSSLENDLYGINYERALEEMADRSIRYVILKNSKEDKILNYHTLRLVSIKTPKGQKLLEELGCKIKYSYQL